MGPAIPLSPQGRASVGAGATGPNQLGAATFTLYANAQPLNAGLASAQASAQQASRQIGQSFGRGSNAAMGLLYLGQTVDDLQYGFRAIVNNISQVAMAMGAGAGLAGAVGITAVAVNQLVNHWETLQRVMSNSEGFQAAVKNTEGLRDSVSRFFGMLGESFVAMHPEWKGFVNALEAARVQAQQAAEGATDANKVKGIGSASDAERGRIFNEAVEAFGGGSKLIGEVTERILNHNPLMSRMDAEGMAAAKIMAGLQGTQFAPGEFGMGFEKALEPILWKNFTDKLNKQGAEFEKDTPNLHRNLTHELNQEGAENERLTREKLEKEKRAERERIQDQIEALDVQRDAIVKASHDVNSSHLFSNTRAFSGNMLTGSLEGVAKAHLKVSEKIEDQIKGLRTDLKHLDRKMRFDV